MRGPDPEDQARLLRVMTWNLWWRFGSAWRDRQGAILSTLRRQAPDVVGLQEVWGTAQQAQSQVLADRLGMHSAYAAPSLPLPPSPVGSPDQESVEVGVAVLSRWPILDAHRHWLPSGHRDGVVALAVVIDHPLGHLHVASCCLDWDEDFGAQRLRQTRDLAALLTDARRDGPLPVILTADLNAPPDSPEIRVLTDVLVDAWVAAGGDPEGGHTLSTSNELASQEAWQVDHRIDYVLARPGEPCGRVVVERAFVAAEKHEGLQASDHFAVVAELLL